MSPLVVERWLVRDSFLAVGVVCASGMSGVRTPVARPHYSLDRSVIAPLPLGDTNTIHLYFPWRTSGCSAGVFHISPPTNTKKKK